MIPLHGKVARDNIRVVTSDARTRQSHCTLQQTNQSTRDNRYLISSLSSRVQLWLMHASGYLYAIHECSE